MSFDKLKDSILSVFLWGLIFGLSYFQLPLYSTNQNTYFFHGLADAGFGYLQHDWLASTRDPFPLFSLIVRLTYQYLPTYFFYLWYLLLFGVYIHSLLGICRVTTEVNQSKDKYYTFLLFLIFLHSILIGHYSGAAIGVNLQNFFLDGLAGQYLLGYVFQPSLFGVLILLSLYLFLIEKPFQSVGVLLLSAAFHSSYLLVAAYIVTGYAFDLIIKDRDYQGAVAIGLTAFMLALPMVIYILLNFEPGAKDLLQQAQAILYTYRIPHHADPAIWFGKTDLAKIFLIGAALFIYRKTRLARLLSISALLASLLMLAQIFSESQFLALLFPWRISVILVPITTALLLAKLVDRVFKDRGRFWLGSTPKYLFMASAITLPVTGVYATYSISQKRANSREFAVMNFVKEHKQAEDLYLIPPSMQDFRLYTGAPAFVDFKSHPYRAEELIEWYARLSQANDFYATLSAITCNKLNNISSKHEITHVLFDADKFLSCDYLKTIYRDDYYVLSKIARGDAE